MMRLALLLLAGAAVAAAQSNKMGLWSPLYYKLNPSGQRGTLEDTENEYNRFIDAVSEDKCIQSSYSFLGAILTGPTSRPPPLKNEPSPGKEARADEYKARFDVLAKAPGWQPFGYIYTKYGQRPLKEVEEDIVRWCDEENGFRSSVRGIFIDSVAESFNCSAKDKGNPDKCAGDYYKAVVDTLNAKCESVQQGKAMIMLNPGRTFSECKFLADNNIGFVNGWEDTFDTYEKFLAKKWIDCPCKNTKLPDGSFVRCVASIHSVPEDITQDQAAEVMSNMAKNGFSAIFMTENQRPKHYETVPKIWPQTMAAACAVDAYVPVEAPAVPTAEAEKAAVEAPAAKPAEAEKTDEEKKAAEEAAKKAAEQEAAKKKADEEAAKKKAEEEAAKPAEAEKTDEEKKAAEEEAAKKAAEQEAAKKKADEEAAKKKADEEAAKKKADEEAAKKKAEEEAAKKKAEEDAAKKKADEDAAKKKADEEAAKKAEEAAKEAAKKAAEDAKKPKHLRRMLQA